MKQNLITFYNNWQSKATSITEHDLSSIYDKYITLFVIYNNLYNQIPDHLKAMGKTIPKKIYDNIAATELVIQFLGAESILDTLNLHNNDSDIEAIIDLIENESFYIKIKDGKRQRKEDLKILSALKSSDYDKKAISILQVLYYIRCNLYHGHKDFDEYQRQLIEPLSNILTSINCILFDKLNNL